jgi:hypothetical protein
MGTSVGLGSHTYFFGQIVAVRCSVEVLTADGRIDPDRLQPMAGFLDSYWSLGDPVLMFGAASTLAANERQKG